MLWYADAMQLRLIAVDKIRTPYVAQACAEFRKRLRPMAPYEEVEVRAASGAHPGAAIRDETERILKLLRPDESVWLLERTGTELSSEALARKIDGMIHMGTSRLTFVVAGTYGAGDALMERADFKWSLSQLTFLHEWARMIVLEQLYRAAKISRNEPYHH
jgi:23S rRNA (pseudouridine1915-N3)-methyltransferase